MKFLGMSTFISFRAFFAQSSSGCQSIKMDWVLIIIKYPTIYWHIDLGFQVDFLTGNSILLTIVRDVLSLFSKVLRIS